MLRSLILILLLSGAARAETITGPVNVIDGDTIDVGDVRVRLYGIDAPEIGQSCTADGNEWDCGRWSRRQVVALYQGRRASCARLTTDRYGRMVARCTVNGRDIGARLVADGIAQAYRRYALDYVGEEKAASISGLGIWRGEMQSPADFRASANAAVPGECVIKGNISGNGRINHLPGQEHYTRTRITASKGERWFCTEVEARAAGWRKARR